MSAECNIHGCDLLGNGECRECVLEFEVERLESLATSHARDIERLSSDLADAEAEVERLQHDRDVVAEGMDVWRSRALVAEAERDRYREDLRGMERMASMNAETADRYREALERIAAYQFDGPQRELARSALAVGGDPASIE